MSNLIVALGGGPDRKKKAVELFRQDTVNNAILFTGEPESKLGTLVNDSSASDLLQLYLQFGLTMPEALAKGLIPLRVSRNTIEDFRVIYSAMTSVHLATVTVVTSDYQIARAKMISSFILAPFFSPQFVAVPSLDKGKSRRWVELIAYMRNFITLRTGINV